MSSKRAQRRRVCGKKRRFADATVANGAAHSLMTRKQSIWPITGYLCRFCRWWHVGHAPRRSY